MKINVSDREAINAKIGALLGFTWVYDQAGYRVQVRYPEDWGACLYAVPADTVPDFLKIMEEYCTFVNRHPLIPKSRVPDKIARRRKP